MAKLQFLQVGNQSYKNKVYAFSGIFWGCILCIVTQ